MRNRILAGVAGLALAGLIPGSALAFRIGESMPGATRADGFRLGDYKGFAQSPRPPGDVKAIVGLSPNKGHQGLRKLSNYLLDPALSLAQALRTFEEIFLGV